MKQVGKLRRKYSYCIQEVECYYFTCAAFFRRVVSVCEFCSVESVVFQYTRQVEKFEVREICVLFFEFILFLVYVGFFQIDNIQEIRVYLLVVCIFRYFYCFKVGVLAYCRGQGFLSYSQLRERGLEFNIFFFSILQCLSIMFELLFIFMIFFWLNLFRADRQQEVIFFIFILR